MINKNAWLIFIMILFLLLPAGCGITQKPADSGQTDNPPAAASPDKTGIDQNDGIKVAQAFITALRTADLNTLRQIGKFYDEKQTPEHILKKYGEDLSQIPAEEMVITGADLGPGVTGVFFAGIKNDPGFILLAVKIEQIDNKYYVVIVTDDPEYEF